MLHKSVEYILHLRLSHLSDLFTSCRNILADSSSKNNSGSPVRGSKSSLSAHRWWGGGGTTGIWNSRSSSVMDKEEDTEHDLQPSFSKMLELDIVRHRQPETLLGKLIRQRQFIGILEWTHGKTVVHWCWVLKDTKQM